MPKPGRPLKFTCQSHCFFAISLLLLTCVAPSLVVGQPPESVNPNDEDPERREILKFIYELEDGVDGPVQAAETFDVAWEMAVRREDPILNSNTGDAQVLRPGQHEVNAGARARLQRIYENGSDRFHTAYEELVAVKAKTSLTKSLETGSIRDLTQVILRYQFTAAGQQALENIIQLRLSRGEYLAASLQYGRLLRLKNDQSAKNRTRLAMLWWKAGLRLEAVDYLQNAITPNAGEQINLDGKQLTLPSSNSDLFEWMTLAFGRSGIQESWNQPGGNYRRIGSQRVGPPDLQPIWSVSGFECAECVDCVEDDEINVLLQPLEKTIQDRFQLGLVSNLTMAPVAQPVVVGDRLIFRGVAKLRCVDSESGELQWESTLIDRALNSALESWRRRGMGNELVLQNVQSRLADALSEHWTLANVGGQLTANAELVFVVEESTSETARFSSQTAGETAVNYLRAYDIRTGRLKGQAGGSMGASGRSGRANPLAGMYFLGAPLILDNQIYVMAENDQGIFLLQIRTIPMFDEEGQLDIRPITSQLLSIPRLTLKEHPVRKLAGLTPSFSKGLLVCNTCDEQVIAVSADDQSVRWIYRYPGNGSISELSREFVIGGAIRGEMSRLSDQGNRWVDALPRIHTNRVYLTPRDCDRLICLDLDSGKQIWSQPRGFMRQLAVVTDDRLVLIGRRHVECRDAATGKQIWKYQFESEKVCGRAINNGAVIQVPTSEPSFVTFDIATGRRLLTQSIPNGLLGNVVSMNDRLYSQTMSGVTAYQMPSANQASPVAKASRLLLSANVEEAEKQLALDKLQLEEFSARRREVDDMMIELLLESVRIDFEGNAERIAELKVLLGDSTVSDEDLTQLMFSMVGMSVGDTAVLPEQWRRLNKNRNRLSQLQALVARRTVANSTESAQKVAEQLIGLLNNREDLSESKIGDVRISSWRNTLASVRRAIIRQPEPQRKEIEQRVGQHLQQRVLAAESKAEAMVFWQALLTCDLTAFAADLAENSEAAIPLKLQAAIRNISFLDAIDDGFTDGATLLKNWSTNNPLFMLDLLSRTKIQTGKLQDPPIAEGLVGPSAARDFVLPSRIETENSDWFAIASKKAQPKPYVGIPKVIESDARIGQSPAPLFMDSPVRNIRILGGSGAFANWNLLQQPRVSTIHAYDADGRLRWSFEPENSRAPVPSRNQPPSYAVAYGQFLALQIQGTLFMLDCSDVNDSQVPTLLWKLNIATEIERPSGNQTYVQAYLRTVQYDMLSAGPIPVGEFSSLGVPVYSGQTLTMLNVLSGVREWTIEGLPDDCTITSVNDEIMLMSTASGTVECRSCLDGSVTAVNSLPEWWVDAKENSNASVHQVELTPGESVRWMVDVRDGGALVWNRNTEFSALEFFDLKSGANAWQVKLPQDTVVSNIVDGHVALLSDGKNLQIIDAVSGTRVCQHEVPEAIKSMYVYLRHSAGQWLVLTNAFDPKLENDVPPQQTVGVNGHIYSVDSVTGNLSWTKEIRGEYLKVMSPSQAVISPTVPLLLLMKRPRTLSDPSRNGARGPAYYQANVFDVRSGKVLYQNENLGRQLSYHCMNLKPQDHVVTIGFGIRDVVFDFSEGRGEAEPNKQ